MFKEAEGELRRRRLEQALTLYTSAELSGHDADACSAGRWICHMLCGDFEKAWKESDAIAARGNPDPHRFWDGQSFAGRRVLLRCLHGLGDTVQFLRYAPLIRREARSLTIEAQPRLKPLVECCGLADNVITWGEPEPEWDQQMEVMELPRIFRTTLESIPSETPYLRLRVASCMPEMREVFRVALVWASGPFNAARSIPLRILSRLCGVDHCEFFSFQGGPEREELAASCEPIHDWEWRTDSVLGAALSLSRMDLLITADTMMAHLAGALGRRVWTLLPFEGDWRWMLDRTNSPWYPTMRLFRQTKPGDWESAVQEVRGALESTVSGTMRTITRAAVRAV